MSVTIRARSASDPIGYEPAEYDGNSSLDPIPIPTSTPDSTSASAEGNTCNRDGRTSLPVLAFELAANGTPYGASTGFNAR